MRLRKPCEHDRYDAHTLMRYDGRTFKEVCPGGEFLPEDAVVIEKGNGEWQLPPKAWEFLNLASIYGLTRGSKSFFDEFAVALAVDQVGEPG